MMTLTHSTDLIIVRWINYRTQSKDQLCGSSKLYEESIEAYYFTTRSNYYYYLSLNNKLIFIIYFHFLK